jgi:hypothetical protein
MKTRITFFLMAGALALGTLLLMSRTEAQAPKPASAARCEVALIKWDGPDRVQFITPQKAEVVRVFKRGVELPSGIHDEQFCLAWAANELAKEGWEPVNLNATRILMRREIAP